MCWRAATPQQTGKKSDYSDVPMGPVGATYQQSPGMMMVPRELLERALFHEVYVKDDIEARDELRAMLKEKP